MDVPQVLWNVLDLDSDSEYDTRRCLEEGAEEFILKPVKLADVERFKGHIIKGLSKEQQQPASNKRKSMSEDLDDLPAQPPERRPRLGELSGA